LGSVGSINPLRIDVDGFSQMIYFALISLIANLTHEQRNAFLPIHSNVHGIIVVAEEACKCCGKRFPLPGTSWLSRRLLSFSHPCVTVPQPWSLLDRKEGVALLVCKVCDQRYQSKVNHLTEPIDIYSEWIDAADAAQNEAPPRRPVASSSRAAPRAAAVASDDD